LKINKILVGVDGSKESKRALLKAFNMAEKFESKMILIYVIPERLIDFWNDAEYVPKSKTPQINLLPDSQIRKNAMMLLEKIVSSSCDVLVVK